MTPRTSATSGYPIVGLDPTANGQLTREEIDHRYRQFLSLTDVPAF